MLKHCPGSSDLHTRTWPSERSHHTSRCSWDENAFDLKQVFHNLSCTHTHECFLTFLLCYLKVEGLKEAGDWPLSL